MSEVFSGNENLNQNTEKQKNNPLTPEQIEDFSTSQKLYKERLSLVEKRATLREANYDTAKQLLQENPNQRYFAKFEGKFYKDTPDVINQTGKSNVDVDIIGRKELEEYIKTYEKEEQTSKNIDSLLRNNPNQETFYELDGRYYISNPTRVPGSNIDSIIRVKEVSRDEMAGKLEGLEKGSIESVSLRLDRLIANTNDGNLRNYLMDLRTNVSLNGNNDFILTFGERVGQLLNLFEKAEIKPLSVKEIGEIALLSFNILRSGISDLTKVIISYIKDVSSSKLYKFGDEDSDYEAYIRESFEKGNIGDVISLLNGVMSEENVKQVREGGIDLASMPLALSAGGIDGFLDYVQSGIDIVVTPDTMLQNVYQIGKELVTNGGDFTKELLSTFKKSSDVVYVLSYIVSVILCFIYYPSKLGVLAMPNTIMKGLEASGKIPANMMGNVESFLGKNLQKLEVFVNDKVKGVNIGSGRILKGGKELYEGGLKTRDSLDSSNTLVSSIQVNAQLLRASREALAITNNSLKLAQIFGDSILGRTNEALTTKNAMNVYKETILKGDENRFNTDDIDALIEKTKGETRYNLVLVREKLQEVEKTMETEVLPNWSKYQKFTKKLDMENIQILKDNLLKNEKEFNQLANIIFRNYIK